MPLIVWCSAAFAFLMRPSVELSKTIDHELREFDGGRPAAGVHIRHCDKGLIEATLRPLADYMGLLQNHSHRADTMQVRLITCISSLGTSGFHAILTIVTTFLYHCI